MAGTATAKVAKTTADRIMSTFILLMFVFLLFSGCLGIFRINLLLEMVLKMLARNTYDGCRALRYMTRSGLISHCAILVL